MSSAYGPLNMEKLMSYSPVQYRVIIANQPLNFLVVLHMPLVLFPLADKL